MKRFKLIPVAFRQYAYPENEGGGHYISEVHTMTLQYNPETQKEEDVRGGVQMLEIALERGWNIVSIQTAATSGNQSISGSIITQYLLSIDIPDEIIPGKE